MTITAITWTMWLLLAATASPTVPPRTPLPESTQEEALFVDAERLEREGRLEDALREYEILWQQYPTDDLAPVALIRLARGYLSMGDNAAASSWAQKIVDDYTGVPQQADAYLLFAEIQESQARTPEHFEATIAAYRRVRTLFPSTRFMRLNARSEASIRAGDLSSRLGNFDAAAGFFIRAIEQEPASDWTSKARLGLGRALLSAGNWLAASEVLTRVRSTASNEDSPEFNLDAANAALRSLTLLHRVRVRQPAWVTSARLVVPGLSFEKPIGVAAREDGALIVVDEGKAFVAVIQPEGSLLSPPRPRGQAHRPAWDSTGAPHVVTEAGQVIFPLTQARHVLMTPDGQERKRIRGLTASAHGASGDWYMLDRNPRRILLFDADFHFREILSNLDAMEPVDLSIDPQGRPVYLDRRRKQVVRLDGNRPTIVAADQSWDRPEAVTVDALGSIYVLDRDLKRIDVFSEHGERIQTIHSRLGGGVEFRSPRDIAVDGSGRIFVSDYDAGMVIVIE